MWNPVALALLQKDETKASRIFGNVYGEVAFMPELKYRANFGVDIYNSSQDTFRPSTIPVANTEGNPDLSLKQQPKRLRCIIGCLSKL